MRRFFLLFSVMVCAIATPLAAAVLAGLDPQIAYTISVVLAARNADVPKQ